MKWLQPHLSQLLEKSDSGVWGDEDLAGGISVLRSTNMSNDGTIDFENLALRDVPAPKRIEKALCPGDIILENSGGGPKQPVGRVCFFHGDEREHVVGNFCRRLRPNRQLVDPRFLFWRLFYGHATGQTLRYQTQTTGLRNLQFRAYANQIIDLPSLSEQTRIVEILDEADRLRHLRRNADLKFAQVLRALFIKMFGDPVSNPMAWPMVRVKDVARVVGGATPRTDVERFFGGDILWATPKDVSVLRDYVIGDTATKLTAEGFASCSTAMLPAGSMLLSSRAPIGLVAINEQPMCTNQGFKSLIPQDVNVWYLMGWATMAKEYIQAQGRGATFAEVSKAIVENLELPLPDRDLQDAFAHYMTDIRAARVRAYEAADKLDQVWGELLERAFAGRLTTNWRLAHAQELLPEMQKQIQILDVHVAKGAAS